MGNFPHGWRPCCFLSFCLASENFSGAELQRKPLNKSRAKKVQNVTMAIML
jgi:hypothetical protein